MSHVHATGHALFMSINNIPYSALFSRRLNFEVFADFILPAKIAPSKLT